MVVDLQRSRATPTTADDLAGVRVTLHCDPKRDLWAAAGRAAARVCREPGARSVSRGGPRAAPEGAEARPGVCDKGVICEHWSNCLNNLYDLFKSKQGRLMILRKNSMVKWQI